LRQTETLLATWVATPDGTGVFQGSSSGADPVLGADFTGKSIIGNGCFAPTSQILSNTMVAPSRVCASQCGKPGWLGLPVRAKVGDLGHVIEQIS